MPERESREFPDILENSSEPKLNSFQLRIQEIKNNYPKINGDLEDIINFSELDQECELAWGKLLDFYHKMFNLPVDTSKGFSQMSDEEKEMVNDLIREVDEIVMILESHASTPSQKSFRDLIKNYLTVVANLGFWQQDQDSSPLRDYLDQIRKSSPDFLMN